MEIKVSSQLIQMLVIFFSFLFLFSKQSLASDFPDEVNGVDAVVV